MAVKPSSKSVSSKVASDTVDSSSPESTLTKYLNETKTEHFNYVEDTNYCVSTGSLNLDGEIGGFGPGFVRLVGPSSAGKSSFALNVARNFVATVPHSRILYIKSEARLSDQIQSRVGLPFTKDPAQWVDGSVFVFECNTYEVIVGLLRKLVVDNPTQCVYMVILDSMDGLNLRDDQAKTVDQANRVAGSALITTQFLQKISVAMTKYGHLCLFLSQVRDSIKLDPYAKGPVRQVTASGGNAIQHYASHVLEFQEWYESSLILEDPEARVDRLKNKPLGHICKVKIAKTDQEKRHITVEIPIKHGVINGSAIWREREIAEQAIQWGLIAKKGGWLTLTDVLRRELAEKADTPDTPEQINGLAKLYAYLTANPKVSDYLYARFRDLIAAASAPAVESAIAAA